MSTYQLLPRLGSDEMEALRADIELHGVRVPVDVDENGEILDGHHRVEIANALGLQYDTRLVEGLTHAEKVGHALAVNCHRRALSASQKRELLRVSLASDPEASDREHARNVGTDHKTAGNVREGMEGRGEIPHVPARKDSAGRKQPAPPTLDERFAAAIAEFPELAGYGKQKATALLIAEQLRGFSPAEREARLENLRKANAAKDNGDSKPSGPTAAELAVRSVDLMFGAATTALAAFTKHGGSKTAAMAECDQLTLHTWAEQFASLASQAADIAAACQPERTLRRVQ